MNTTKLLSLYFFLSFIATFYSQKVPINKELQKKLIAYAEEKYKQESAQLEKYLNDNNLPRTIKTDRALIQAKRVNIFGALEYVTTNNANAAKTINTNQLYSGGTLGLSLDGTGIVIGEWDGGAVRTTHQEFNNTGTSRVTQRDGVTTLDSHSTHVAGTILAGGVQATAKGMAFNARISAYDFTNDFSEMTNEAVNNNMLVSNHSYGQLVGWDWNGSSWQWSNPFTSILGQNEDFYFGYYSDRAADWDNLSNTAPYYLIVKAAGNDNNDGPGTGSPYPNDGPYDCLDSYTTAKNPLIVGAVNDIPGGYTQPSDVVIASFSSTGPTDDGRIKPDIVANGVGLYSCNSTSNTSYSSSSGTSMSTPSVTGSIALLQQHYYNVNNAFMTSAMAKSVIIHTANEAGTSNGPDYIYGWGLMNSAKAAQKISEVESNSLAMNDLNITQGGTIQIKALAKGTEPIVATMVWTDPEGSPITNYFTVLDNPTKMLVNDLNLNITSGSTTYYPWKLNVNSPSSPATNSGVNNIDNVEKVEAGTLAAGTLVTLNISHSGTLTGGEEWFALSTSGLFRNDEPYEAVTIGTSEFKTTNAYYTTEIGTANGSNTTCASNTPKNNVWFKFVATNSNQSIFLLSGGSYGTLLNPVLSLWNNNQTTQLYCSQSTANTAFITATGLTVGQTYYLSVDNANSSEKGSFTLFAEDSEVQSGSSINLQPGTMRYNGSNQKFEGWNGTTWIPFN